MNSVRLIRTIFLFTCVLLLEGGVRFGLIPKRVLLPPSEMLVALMNLIMGGKVYADIAQTFLCIATSLAAAVVGGFFIGAAVHRLPRLRRALDPFFATYYAVPLFIFYPVLIAIFDLSLLPIILMGFAFSVVAMIIGTLNGLDRVPPVLMKVARVHRMSRFSTAVRLQLPAAIPHLFTGFKLAAAYSVVGVVASELILAPSGLGHAISFAYNDFDNETMYGLMLLLLIVVLVVNMQLHAWEQRLLKQWTGR